MKDERGSGRLDVLVEEVASLLEATARADGSVYHLQVDVSPSDDEEDHPDEDDSAPSAAVTLSTSDDGQTIFVTRHLAAHDGSLDLEELLHEVSGTLHVQLSIDDENDLVLGAAAPATAPAEWLAEVVQEVADFAPELAQPG